MTPLANLKPVPAPSFDWKRPPYQFSREMQFAIERTGQSQPRLITIGGEIQLTPNKEQP